MVERESTEKGRRGRQNRLCADGDEDRNVSEGTTSEAMRSLDLGIKGVKKEN